MDNLALADRTLGNLMAILQQSPRWKDKTVIDYAGRPFLAHHSVGLVAAWTDEDDQASRNEFDPRLRRSS